MTNAKDGIQSPQMQSFANKSSVDPKKGIKDEKTTKPNDVALINTPSNGPSGQSTEGEILDAIEALSL